MKRLSLVLLVILVLLLGCSRDVSTESPSQAAGVEYIKWIEVTAPEGFDVRCFGNHVWTLIDPGFKSNASNAYVVCIPTVYETPR